MHEHRLGDVTGLLESFLDESSALREKRGALLIQLPPSLAYAATLSDFFNAFRARYAGFAACEPRHMTWFCGEETRCCAHTRSRASPRTQPCRAAASPAVTRHRVIFVGTDRPAAITIGTARNAFARWQIPLHPIRHGVSSIIRPRGAQPPMRCNSVDFETHARKHFSALGPGTTRSSSSKRSAANAWRPTARRYGESIGSETSTFAKRADARSLAVKETGTSEMPIAGTGAHNGNPEPPPLTAIEQTRRPSERTSTESHAEERERSKVASDLVNPQIDRPPASDAALST